MYLKHSEYSGIDHCRVGLGKFGKKNKHRALKLRHGNVQNYVDNIKKISVANEKNSKI